MGGCPIGWAHRTADAFQGRLRRWQPGTTAALSVARGMGRARAGHDTLAGHGAAHRAPVAAAGPVDGLSWRGHGYTGLEPIPGHRYLKPARCRGRRAHGGSAAKRHADADPGAAPGGASVNLRFTGRRASGPCERPCRCVVSAGRDDGARDNAGSLRHRCGGAGEPGVVMDKHSWAWFHRFASPPYLYRVAGLLAPWFAWTSVVVIGVGLYGGLWSSPPD